MALVAQFVVPNPWITILHVEDGTPMGVGYVQIIRQGGIMIRWVAAGEAPGDPQFLPGDVGVVPCALVSAGGKTLSTLLDTSYTGQDNFALNVSIAYAPITITSVSLDHADADGGQVLFIDGDFSSDVGKALRVYVGPAGSLSDTLCLSGVAGQGVRIYPIGPGRVRCFLPMLTPGGPYNVFVVREDSTRAGLVLSAITVLPRMYYSGVFDIRTVLPLNYATGARNIDVLEALP